MKKVSPFELNIAENVAKSLRTDSQRLQQILRNLLTNAFKFTHEGTVQLAISRPDPQMCKPLNTEPDSLIQFSVIDDGIGIAKEKQIAIFQAFQQADGSTSRNYGGTGLGLSITKELTHLLGGTIHLESQEGKGSTFSIVLPLSHEGKVTHSDEVLSDLEAIIDTPPETQRAQLPKRLAPEEMLEPRDPVPLSPVNGGGDIANASCGK